MSEPEKQAEATLPVPSGQPVRLQDIFWEEGDDLLLRVRFVAPQIARNGGSVDHDTAITDMRHLCEHFVLAQLTEGDEMPAQIILSLSDIEVPFGEADADATQFFEAYRLDGTNCISELY